MFKLLSICLLFLLPGMAPAQHRFKLGSEISSVDRPSGNYSPPAVQYGHILRCLWDSSEVLLMDRAGQKLFSKRPELPEASNVILAAAHVTPSGGVVSAFSGIAKDGRFATFLAWMGRDGVTRKVVRTAPYAAAQLKVLPDGSVWTFGRTFDSNFVTVPDNTIRRYSSDGELLLAALPSEQFRQGSKHPAARSRLLDIPGGAAAVSVIRREVVFLNGSGAITSKVSLDPILTGTDSMYFLEVLNAPDGALVFAIEDRKAPAGARNRYYRLREGVFESVSVQGGDGFDLAGIDADGWYLTRQGRLWTARFGSGDPRAELSRD